MVSYSKIEVQPFLDGHAEKIVLNDPKGNVLDAIMMGEINDLLDSYRDNKDLKLLCFTGSGKHFCFGASVPEHVGEKAAAMLGAFHGMFLRLAELGIPTVAAVNGCCLGGGMELAAFCNWVFAHPGALFAQPEIQLAVFPPVASLVLPYKVGQATADDINLTGRNIKAVAAQEMGLVDRVVEDPMAEVETWAEQEFSPKSASSLRFANKASRWMFNKTFTEQIPNLEKFYLQELMASDDANEGLKAFLEKRKPEWTNR